MKKRMAILFIIGLALSGCADVQLKPNELYKVTLPANPTTGYQWRIRQDQVPRCLEFVRKDYTSDEATEGIVGVGGQSTFVFRAVEKGKGTLTFEYIRTWEQEKKPLQEKIFWVEVH